MKNFFLVILFYTYSACAFSEELEAHITAVSKNKSGIVVNLGLRQNLKLDDEAELYADEVLLAKAIIKKINNDKSAWKILEFFSSDRLKVDLPITIKIVDKNLPYAMIFSEDLTHTYKEMNKMFSENMNDKYEKLYNLFSK